MMYITRRERFNAAHRLFRPEWSDEKNLEIFGKCSNPNWHGHNYTLFITVKGEVSKETGFVMNLKDLSFLLKSKIIDKVDHHLFDTGIVCEDFHFAVRVFLNDKIIVLGARQG